ncbi:MAG: hypothetical protein KAH96_00860 [Alphaproteobacteria bacterium]|nr:hypothetical protein [Alphaproteobacteria bacterium]
MSDVPESKEGSIFEHAAVGSVDGEVGEEVLDHYIKETKASMCANHTKQPQPPSIPASPLDNEPGDTELEPEPEPD